jgi:hypothetical protein
MTDEMLPATTDTPRRREDIPEEADERLYQQAARGRIVALPLALGFISLGVLLLAAPSLDGVTITIPIVILLMTASLVLTNLFRFFASGRRERGLFFLALVLLLTGAVLAFMVNVDDALAWWPLIIVGMGLALIITFVVERQHERGLIGAGLVMIAAAGVALLVTHELVPQELVDILSDYWPLIIAFIGITLIPLAFRRG